ncbi:unnamed protein product, partial [Symbiodinium sp. CCMP2456]
AGARLPGAWPARAWPRESLGSCLRGAQRWLSIRPSGAQSRRDARDRRSSAEGALPRTWASSRGLRAWPVGSPLRQLPAGGAFEPTAAT